ncbi:MAG: T9SS type A sorting domain-containing protein, partial [bacterium]
NGDYHLQSIYGSYHGGMWSPDANHSPCIDTGDPNSMYSVEPEPNGRCINMGAYGNTEEASKSRYFYGNVSGIWTSFNNPYSIIDEITIAADDTLIIEPGVEVIFQGHYKFIVNGWLLAEGTEQDSILFTAADTSEGWHGIRFIDAPDSSRLSYCTLTYGKATGANPNDCGGAIRTDNSTLVLTNCLIERCHANLSGGAIDFAWSVGKVYDTIFRYNSSGIAGGATQLFVSDVVLLGCQFVSNITLGTNGGAVYGESCFADIVECTFTQNSAQSGGAINCGSSSDFSLNNCLLVENIAGQYGGGIYHAAGILDVVNCTVSDNTASLGGGISSTDGDIKNSIIWNNTNGQIHGVGGELNYNNIQGGWPTGTGNIDTEPFFVDPDNSDYHLQSPFGSYHGGAWTPDLNNSPCIDAGDPASPYGNEPQPNGYRINMGAYGNTVEASYSNDPAYPDINIELTYVSGSPIGIGGGNIFYEIYVENEDTLTVEFDGWIDITYEGGTPFTAILRTIPNFTPGQIIDRQDMWYPINAGYPAGDYAMTGKVGDFPNEIWDISSFPFVKSGDDDGREFTFIEPDVDFPDPFSLDGLVEGKVYIPETFACAAYPNPFNPTTAISIQLSAFSEVNLSVYDVAGRKVAELIHGYRDAGLHEVTFDASQLASGVYLYRLQTSGSGTTQTTDFSATGKMVLMK